MWNTFKQRTSTDASLNKSILSVSFKVILILLWHFPLALHCREKNVRGNARRMRLLEMVVYGYFENSSSIKNYNLAFNKRHKDELASPVLSKHFDLVHVEHLKCFLKYLLKWKTLLIREKCQLWSRMLRCAVLCSSSFKMAFLNVVKLFMLNSKFEIF